MSRRESRVSTGVRQNDALLEFENFKKKFLLANKHITKLNSTLSVRIEELNAERSALYVENLRLRASEIALTAQLKKERERSSRIMADAEAAIHTLMKSFGSIRKTFNVPLNKPPSPPRPPQPTARRPMLDPDASPHVNRLARPPAFPEIYEEDEEEETSPSPTVRRKKARTSRVPVPVPPPPLVATFQVDVDESLLKPDSKKRISRRQSGLINVVSPPSTSARSVSPGRPPSPAFGSPLRREAGLAEEEEEYIALRRKSLPMDEDDEEGRAPKKEKKRRSKAADADTEGESGSGDRKTREKEKERERDRDRERRRPRDDDNFVDLAGPSTTKFRLKDVTNSLPPLEIGDLERQHTPDSEYPTSAMTTSTRPMLSTPATTPAPSALPTPRTSSPPPIPIPDPETSAAGGRERRVRKSVNYAEPKLNTKMRKPDPPPVPSSSKRTSMPAVSSTAQSPRTSLDAPEPPDPAVAATSIKRKKSRPRLPPDDDDDDDEGTQADEEFGLGFKGNWVNLEGRRRSGQVTSRRTLIGDGGDEGPGRRHSTAM